MAFATNKGLLRLTVDAVRDAAYPMFKFVVRIPLAVQQVGWEASRSGLAGATQRLGESALENVASLGQLGSVL